LLYYSGHGFSVNGTNYLPSLTGDWANKDSLLRSSTAVAGIVERMSLSKAARKILILDTHYPPLPAPGQKK
jgi:uncharacterized caspase-like protein